MPPRKTTRKRKPGPKRKRTPRSDLPAEQRPHWWFKPGQSGNPEKVFKPGQSGNPAGGSKKLRLRYALKAKLEEVVPEDPKQRSYAEILMERLVAAGAKDWRANLAVYEIFEGKPKQPTEDLTPDRLNVRELMDGLPVEVQLAIVENAKKKAAERENS